MTSLSSSPRIGICANVVFNDGSRDGNTADNISEVALATAAATGLNVTAATATSAVPASGSGRRSIKLHKSLQRRNNSLRPSYEHDGDIFHTVQSKINHNSNKDNSSCDKEKEEAEVVVETNQKLKASNVSPLNDVFQEAKEPVVETQKQISGKADDEAREDSSTSSSKSPSPSPPPVTTVQELKSQLEILAESIKMQQERLNRPPNVDAYLPVASPRAALNAEHNISRRNNVSASAYQNQHHHVAAVDAEYEYRTLFNAPSHVVLESKPTFDTAEVSEITMPHGLNTKGAAYVQRRLQGPSGMARLQQQQHLSPALNVRLQQRREPEETFRGDSNSILKGAQGEVGQEITASIDVNVRNLRYLGKAVEQAKKDLQRGVGTTMNVVKPPSPAIRHGLPYEKTDFHADESSEDASEDMWDQAIHYNKSSSKQQQQKKKSNKRNDMKIATASKRKSLDPESGVIGVAAQGPPTPRVLSTPSPEKLQMLVKETVSPKGEIIVDTTEIRDEDIYGVNVLETTGSREEPIEIIDDDEEDIPDDGSELLGEDLIITSTHQDKNDGTPPNDKKKEEEKKKKKKKWLNRGNLSPQNKEKDNSCKGKDMLNPIPPPQVPGDLPTESGQAQSPTHAYGYEKYFMQQQAAMLKRDENAQKEAQKCQDNDVLKSAIEENAKRASGFYKSSIDFIKSFAQQTREQLQKIQQIGLIEESDMDGMLGVLDKNLEETNREVPNKADDVVIFLGDEFEKSACGVDENVLKEGPKNFVNSSTHTSKHNKCPDAVDSMLDSMKKAYRKSIEHCGLNKDTVKEHTKAIEDMVSDLKTSYGDKISSCGLGESCKNDTMMASIEQMKNSSLKQMNTLAAMSFDDSPYVGNNARPEFSTTAAEEEENERNQLKSPVDADIFGSIDIPNDCLGAVMNTTPAIIEEADGDIEYPLQAGDALKAQSSQAVEEFLQNAGRKDSYASKLSRYRARRRPGLSSPSVRSPTSLSSTGADVPSISENAKEEMDSNVVAAFAAVDPPAGRSLNSSPSGYAAID